MISVIIAFLVPSRRAPRFDVSLGGMAFDLLEGHAFFADVLELLPDETP